MKLINDNRFGLGQRPNWSFSFVDQVKLIANVVNLEENMLPY